MLKGAQPLALDSRQYAEALALCLSHSLLRCARGRVIYTTAQQHTSDRAARAVNDDKTPVAALASVPVVALVVVLVTVVMAVVPAAAEGTRSRNGMAVVATVATLAITASIATK